MFFFTRDKKRNIESKTQKNEEKFQVTVSLRFAIWFLILVKIKNKLTN